MKRFGKFGGLVVGWLGDWLGVARSRLGGRLSFFLDCLGVADATFGCWSAVLTQAIRRRGFFVVFI